MFENFESTKCQSCIIIMECYCHYKSNNIHNTPNRSSHQRCSVKKGVLRNSQNSQENTCARVCNFIEKETLAQVFSSEFCEISENTFFTEHVWATASVQRVLTASNNNITTTLQIPTKI